MAPDVGVTIVSDQTFNPGDTDMTAQLTKIKNSDAEAIVMWTAGPEAAIIAKNVKDLGIDLPLFGSHGIARREFIDGAGDAAEGVRFAAGKVLIPEAYGEGTEAFTVATDFIDRYTAAYGERPEHVRRARLRRPLPHRRGGASASTATSPPRRCATRSRRRPGSWASAAPSPSPPRTTTA